MMLTYSDLLLIENFEDRLEYLRQDGLPSELTFGALRYLGQRFYSSNAWRQIRQFVIARDLGFDLAVPGNPIYGKVLVHHMNPLKPKDIYANRNEALDPEYLITVSHDTHLGIHFGYRPRFPGIQHDERSAGDTKLW